MGFPGGAAAALWRRGAPHTTWCAVQQNSRRTQCVLSLQYTRFLHRFHSLCLLSECAATAPTAGPQAVAKTFTQCHPPLCCGAGSSCGTEAHKTGYKTYRCSYRLFSGQQHATVTDSHTKCGGPSCCKMVVPTSSHPQWFERIGKSVAWQTQQAFIFDH